MKIILKGISVQFEKALAVVAADHSEWDWICKDWVEVPQDVSIEQTDGVAIVTAYSSAGNTKVTNRIYVVEPIVFSNDQAVSFILTKISDSNVNLSDFQSAISRQDFDYGYVYSLAWHNLGYAPGGFEYFVLPFNGPLFTTGFLKLDWKNVKVELSV